MTQAQRFKCSVDISTLLMYKKEVLPIWDGTKRSSQSTHSRFLLSCALHWAITKSSSRMYKFDLVIFATNLLYMLKPTTFYFLFLGKLPLQINLLKPKSKVLAWYTTALTATSWRMNWVKNSSTLGHKGRFIFLNSSNRSARITETGQEAWLDVQG